MFFCGRPIELCHSNIPLSPRYHVSQSLLFEHNGLRTPDFKFVYDDKLGGIFCFMGLSLAYLFFIGAADVI